LALEKRESKEEEEEEEEEKRLKKPVEKRVHTHILESEKCQD
jgi:hypothetical protein